MRVANKNKQKMYYSNLLSADAEKVREGGHYKTITFDGAVHIVENGDYETVYSTPVEFLGNIAEEGDASIAEFGVDISGYDALLVVEKGSIPITETSVVWYQTEPAYKDISRTIPDTKTADYTVKSIKPSINGFKAVLKRIVK